MTAGDLAVPEIPVVHAVTSDEVVGRPDFLARARAVMDALGPRGAVQLRAPRMAQDAGGAMLEVATALADAQARSGAWLIVNERVDIALMAGARGIQLAGGSLSVADALHVAERAVPTGGKGDPRDEGESRSIGDGPSIAVGASVHELEQTLAARLEGARWVVLSGVLGRHPTAPGHGAPFPAAPDGMALLHRVTRFGGLPVIVIGGVVPQHVAPLRRLGVHGVAAIRGIWEAENAARAALDYLQAYDEQVG